jgi:hypothetical protein
LKLVRFEHLTYRQPNPVSYVSLPVLISRLWNSLSVEHTIGRTMISERVGPLPTEELERFKICSGFHINETFHAALIGETKKKCVQKF